MPGSRLLHSCISAFLAFLLFPSPAVAQTPAWNGRGRVSINGGTQLLSETLSQSFSVTKNLEATPVTVDIEPTPALWFDAGVTARVGKRFGVGVAVSFAARNDSAAVSASVPHPFFFNQPRSLAGSQSATRMDTAVHMDAVYYITRRTLDVLLAAGPTVLYTRRDLVTDVAYTDAYPFDTATFAAATTTRASTTAAGYNVSADATWKLSKRVGLGALARYTRASTTLTAAAGNAPSGHAGGLQVGGGLRLAF